MHSHQEANAEQRKQQRREQNLRAKEKKAREAQVCDYSLLATVVSYYFAIFTTKHVISIPSRMRGKGKQQL